MTHGTRCRVALFLYTCNNKTSGRCGEVLFLYVNAHCYSGHNDSCDLLVGSTCAILMAKDIL